MRIVPLITASDASTSFLPGKHNTKPYYLDEPLPCLVGHYLCLNYHFLCLHDLDDYLLATLWTSFTIIVISPGATALDGCCGEHADRVNLSLCIQVLKNYSKCDQNMVCLPSKPWFTIYLKIIRWSFQVITCKGGHRGLNWLDYQHWSNQSIRLWALKIYGILVSLS